MFCRQAARRPTVVDPRLGALIPRPTYLMPYEDRPLQISGCATPRLLSLPRSALSPSLNVSFFRRRAVHYACLAFQGTDRASLAKFLYISATVFERGSASWHRVSMYGLPALGPVGEGLSWPWRDAVGCPTSDHAPWALHTTYCIHCHTIQSPSCHPSKKLARVPLGRIRVLNSIPVRRHVLQPVRARPISSLLCCPAQ